MGFFAIARQVRTAAVGTSVGLALLLGGCQTVAPAVSYPDDPSTLAVICKSAWTSTANPDAAIGCAGAVAGSYERAANHLANRRQHFRYGEIALSAVSLGLAGFEAHIDTLKATGLAAGTTSVFRSSFQFAGRIDAMAKGSQRLRCVAQRARAAQDADAEAQRFAASTHRTLQLRQQAKLLTSPISAAQLSELHLMLIARQASTRLHRAVLDAIAEIEYQAWSAWRFKEQSADPSQDIGKAITAAVDLGSANRAREDAAEVILTSLFGATDSAVARNAVRKTSEFETALLEVRACVLI